MNQHQNQVYQVLLDGFHIVQRLKEGFMLPYALVLRIVQDYLLPTFKSFPMAP